MQISHYLSIFLLFSSVTLGQTAAPSAPAATTRPAIEVTAFIASTELHTDDEPDIVLDIRNNLAGRLAFPGRIEWHRRADTDAAKEVVRDTSGLPEMDADQVRVHGEFIYDPALPIQGVKALHGALQASSICVEPGMSSLAKVKLSLWRLPPSLYRLRITFRLGANKDSPIIGMSQEIPLRVTKKNRGT